MKSVYLAILLILPCLSVTYDQTTSRQLHSSTLLHGPVKEIVIKRVYNKLGEKRFYPLPGDTMKFDKNWSVKYGPIADESDFYFYSIINYLSLKDGSIKKDFPSIKGLKMIDMFNAMGEKFGIRYVQSNKEPIHTFFVDERNYDEKDSTYKLSRSNSKNIVVIKEDHIYYNDRLEEINFYKFHNTSDVDIGFLGYVYDKHGNWVRRTGYRKSIYNLVIGSIIETRSISYWQ